MCVCVSRNLPSFGAVSLRETLSVRLQSSEHPSPQKTRGFPRRRAQKITEYLGGSNGSQRSEEKGKKLSNNNIIFMIMCVWFLGMNTHFDKKNLIPPSAGDHFA